MDDKDDDASTHRQQEEVLPQGQVMHTLGGELRSQEFLLTDVRRVKTRYGKSRASATSYFVHHAQRISMAASIGDVKGIHKRISLEKQNRRARQCREGSGAAY